MDQRVTHLLATEQVDSGCTDNNLIKDYRRVAPPKVYMTQDNDRNENGEQSNDSVEANHMIDTNKIIEETQENL